MTKHNREKQAEVLRRTQAERKEQKKQQVLKAIQEIINQKQPLTFANIATVAGCSIAYLYKWAEITDYIHELQQQQKTQLHPLEEGDPKPHSLKTLHEVARNRIRQLEAEIKDLKNQNEKLRGHVSEIYELRDECERLRHQLRELTNPNPSSKVVPIRIVTQVTSPVNESPPQPESAIKSNTDSSSQSEIFKLINSLGIKLTAKLKREITHRSPSSVKLSIEAFQQYRSKTDVSNPEACLLTMICDEAKPNGQQNSEPPESILLPSQEPLKPTVREDKELVSFDELSNIFNQK
jgi:predicted ribosome quality control (RQC) complex YloA/Tae2 family protein